MQACIYREYGAPDVVKLAEVAVPSPRKGEILVRVHAASVTTADGRIRASDFPSVFWLPGRLIFGLFRPRSGILGRDFSGTVVATGEGVTRFRVGDRVFGAASGGAHADYLTIAETAAVVLKPPSLTDAEAAAVPFGASCALAFLRDVADVRPGQRVLVVGASGGVGTWAVQLARHLGAEVTAVCSARNADLVRSLGAHHVVDYATGSLAPHGATYDLIFDTIGVTTFASTRSLLAPNGLYLPLNSGLREIVQALLPSWSSGQRVKFFISQNTRAGLEEVVHLLETGALRPVVDQVYPLERIVDAHRRVDGRHKRGTVVVTTRAFAAAPWQIA